MSEQKSFFSTLPGIFTALAGLITAVAGLILALSEIGFIGFRENKETKPVVTAPGQTETVEAKTADLPKEPVASKPVVETPKTPEAPKKPVPATPKPKVVTPKTPEAQKTDGWAIIGFYERGKFSDLKLKVDGDSPAIGRSYDVVENFRLVQKRPEKGQAVITLGIVHPGGSVEVLDIEIAPGTTKVPVWAKLRAVLHPVKDKS